MALQDATADSGTWLARPSGQARKTSLITVRKLNVWWKVALLSRPHNYDDDQQHKSRTVSTLGHVIVVTRDAKGAADS
jgi:hypothetical protein